MKSIFLSWVAFSSLLLQSEEPCLKNIRQITFQEMGFEKAGEAYFSPDSSTIIFQAVPQGETNYQIYTLEIGSNTPRRVSTGKGACTCAFFRPDGEKILFASSHSAPIPSAPKAASGKYEWELTPYMNIYEANPDGTELQALTSGPAYHAECAYSSDGSEIVYASNENGSMNLFLMNADGSNARQVTHTTASYNGGPFLSPDGSKILFRSDRDQKDLLQIFTIDREGNEVQLTHNQAVNWAPYWHPNGKVIAYTTSFHGHHRYEIYLMDIETGKECRLTDSPSFDGLPVFNPTGDLLLWTSKRGDGSCQIFLADFIMPDLFNPAR